MESILDRAARVLARHPAPALPLDELRELVGGSGVGVTEEVLLRALRRGSGRFRLVDPRLGPLRTLERSPDLRRSAAGWGGPPGREPSVDPHRRSGARGDGSPRPAAGSATARVRTRSARGARGTAARPDGEGGGRGPGPVAGLGRPWVVARPSGRERDGRVGLRRLRQSVAHLGWTVDDGSPSEMARWCGLLHEERRVRRTAGRGAASGEPSGAPPPERARLR